MIEIEQEDPSEISSPSTVDDPKTPLRSPKLLRKKTRRFKTPINNKEKYYIKF